MLEAPLSAISQALAMLPPQMDTPEARVMLLAIGLQESEFNARAQILNGGGKGPARGWWQFEQGGGCAGVLRHQSSRYWMVDVCGKRGCPSLASSLWRQIETDDVLAAAAARLLLFTDPKRLPLLGDHTAALALYLRVWRPGKPHLVPWPSRYMQALEAVSEASV